MNNSDEHMLARDLEHILLNTQNIWDDLAGKDIFITGGTGFYGCWLLESLIHANRRLNLNTRITVLTRNPDAFAKKAPHLAHNPSVRLIAGDVRSFDFPPGSFSHIIHAATDTDSGFYSDPIEIIKTIVDGTRHTLEFACHCGAKKFLFTSSGAVYGKQPYELSHLPEEYMGGPNPVDTSAAYAEAKRMAEQLCVLYSTRHDIAVKIARGFAFVGPYMAENAHFAIMNFIRDGVSGRKIQIRGDGTPCRSYLYSADLAIWLWTILVRGESRRPYNVGSEKGLSIAELANLVAEALPDSPGVEILGRPNPGQPRERYVPSTFRAHSALGLEEHISLLDSIQRTSRWLSKKLSG
ncbi:MAG: NAD-dependent epimerase/dehydratase family protein [Syntrophobacteraceae bacterium]|nr:NAD-dependent epimerase/dehydratase family protein [Syntrophobacteraceae bacterium]